MFFGTKILDLHISFRVSSYCVDLVFHLLHILDIVGSGVQVDCNVEPFLRGELGVEGLERLEENVVLPILIVLDREIGPT